MNFHLLASSCSVHYQEQPSNSTKKPVMMASNSYVLTEINVGAKMNSNTGNRHLLTSQLEGWHCGATC